MEKKILLLKGVSDRERTRSAQPALRMTHAIVMSQFSRHLEQPQPQFLGTG